MKWLKSFFRFDNAATTLPNPVAPSVAAPIALVNINNKKSAKLTAPTIKLKQSPPEQYINIKNDLLSKVKAAGLKTTSLNAEIIKIIDQRTFNAAISKMISRITIARTGNIAVSSQEKLNHLIASISEYLTPEQQKQLNSTALKTPAAILNRNTSQARSPRVRPAAKAINPSALSNSATASQASTINISQPKVVVATTSATNSNGINHNRRK